MKFCFSCEVAPQPQEFCQYLDAFLLVLHLQVLHHSLAQDELNFQKAELHPKQHQLETLLFLWRNIRKHGGKTLLISVLQ